MKLARIKSDINRWFAKDYGSSRGYFKTQYYRGLYLFGSYNKYKKIDWQAVRRLVFVCKGNICRSAYAEIVAHSINLNSVSCGVDTDDGFPADKVAIFCAKKKGFDLSKHRTRSIQSLDIKQGDLFIAMEPEQVKSLEQMFDAHHMRTMAGIWTVPKYPYIHDPFGKGIEYFDKCFSYIEKAVHGIEKQIRSSK